MLYLEDYLEMIEHLPQELRDRFTEMREMDLSVQNIMDTLEKRSKIFFGQCRRNELTATAAENEFDSLRKDYYKVLEDADEKVSLASSMHELVERYLRKLDSELFKFKCELEADNNGITEVLEKRSLELDGNNSIQNTFNQKENRYFGSIGSNSLSQTQKEKIFRQKPEKRRDSTNVGTQVIEKRPVQSNILATHSNPVQQIRTIAPSSITMHGNLVTSSINAAINFNSHTPTSSGNLSMTTNPPNTVSAHVQTNKKTSIHASINTSHDLLSNRDVVNPTHTTNLTERDQILLNQRRQKKKITSLGSSVATPGISLGSVHAVTQSAVTTLPVIPPSSPRLPDNTLVVEQSVDGEWTYDPNEPRYCICNQVSYGDMVACDNEACPFEWFHYPCVGITQSPKGKWFCPKCTITMKRRNRKN